MPSHPTWLLSGIVACLVIGGLLSLARSFLGGVLLILAALVVAWIGPFSPKVRDFSRVPATLALGVAAIGMVLAGVMAINAAPQANSPSLVIGSPTPVVRATVGPSKPAGRATAELTVRPVTATPLLFANSTSVVATKTRIDSECDPSYPGVCIKPPPPTLTCRDVPYRRFAVQPPDPHRFDPNKDGIGCE